MFSKLQRSLLIAAFACAGLAQGQEGKRPNTYHSSGLAAQNSRPVSPEVHADGTVTFRIHAPKAQEVSVLLGSSAKPMTRDEKGDWSATLGSLAPEIYSYNFVVDGVRMIDMANPILKNGRAPDASIFEVKGASARFDELRDVPHGKIVIQTYRSSPLKRWRKMYVYVPPQYDTEPNSRFPVLYLRHGSGDNEANWSEDGRAGVILDNLIAEHQAVPMMIVMPNGDTDGTWTGGSSPQTIELLNQELSTDIMPLIERQYRVLSGPENRAIAGLSMGGGQAFTIGLRNLDRFAWVGEFSSGLVSDNEFHLDKHLPGFLDHPDAVNRKLKLLFLSCGTEDPRYNGQLNLTDTLKEHGIRYTWFSTPGAHEWKVWRHSLAAFAKLAFVPGGAAGADTGDEAAVREVIRKYVDAREQKDPKAIEALFTPDADQLVSTGEWRKGQAAVVRGTMASSQASAGKRTITIESVRFLLGGNALAEGRYEIAGTGGAETRKMWTSFVLSNGPEGWKISAIRNMLPSPAR